jgi:hypothetical protein
MYIYIHYIIYIHNMYNIIYIYTVYIMYIFRTSLHIYKFLGLTKNSHFLGPGGLQLLRTDHAESDRAGGLRGQRVQRQDGRPSLGLGTAWGSPWMTDIRVSWGE